MQGGSVERSGMEFVTCDVGTLPVAVNMSVFRGAGGVAEHHLILRPTEYAAMETQLEWVSRAYGRTLEAAGLSDDTAILRRFFCSDVHTQAEALKHSTIADPGAKDQHCAISWVGQAPAAPAKVILWAYHISDPRSRLQKSCDDSHLTLCRGELSHHWTTGLAAPSAISSYEQTRSIFERYDALLDREDLKLADHVMRTWLFVRDIDANYPGMVVARREFFAQRGLTPQTHYVASSGIEATNADVNVKVALDAYAIGGLQPGQVSYLAAPDHMSPTHIYGVTFERGTSIAYRDRKHFIISGTASIDRDGNILHTGDVARQLDRTLENVQALLHHAGAALSDLASLIVYIRDPSDHHLARTKLRERFGAMPFDIVVAPVCRPGWLIEVEGLAVVPASNPKLPEF